MDDPMVKFAAIVSSIAGVIAALGVIWSQPFPEYLKSLGTSLLCILLLWVYVSLFFVRKSQTEKPG